MIKQKYPRAEALKAARHLCLLLADACTRLICAGSLRRNKQMVADVEILYIPIFQEERDGLFGSKSVNCADRIINQFLAEGILTKRTNVNGSTMWGPSNKLALYTPNGVPVDLFQATESNWFNYLVCRTGGKDNNIAICNAAQAKGWKWNPYGPGFTDANGNQIPVSSEQEVFTHAGLPYKEPWERS